MENEQQMWRELTKERKVKQEKKITIRMLLAQMNPSAFVGKSLATRVYDHGFFVYLLILIICIYTLYMNMKLSDAVGQTPVSGT